MSDTVAELDHAVSTALRAPSRRRLDALLSRVLEIEASHGGEDLPRGLYIDAATAIAVVQGGGRRGASTSPVDPEWDWILAAEPEWSWLQEAFALTAAELDAVLLALAPELDSRYARVFGYLNDDVTRARPTVDTILEGTGAGRALLGPDAPLLRHRILRLTANSHDDGPSLLRHAVTVDEQIADLLLGQHALDRRLARCCTLTAPDGSTDEPALHPTVVAALTRLAHDAATPPRVYLHGPVRAGRHDAAHLLAALLRRPLLTLRPDRMAATTDADEFFAVLFREALLQGALLCVDDIDTLPAAALFNSRLSAHPDAVLLTGEHAWTALGDEPCGVTVLPLPLPDSATRRRVWSDALQQRGITLPDSDLDTLAGRFRLGGNQIRDAAQAVDATDPMPALMAAARAHGGHGLEALARRTEPVHTWDDLVVSEDAADQLRELCDRVAHHAQVMEIWGFGAAMSRGRGTCALFAGPPGTGKTMAAEVIAHELGLDLFVVDLSAVVSKYIGETEKNLDRIFDAAEDTDAILLFDEADALFGKRSEVRDAHDRYANIEVAYLLQRMEEYDGLSILATNLRKNIDDAFTRRLAVIIDFPVPDLHQQQRIWRICLPAAAPLADDVDPAELAAQFPMSGGNIRNCALAAAYRAAGAGTPITMDHLAAAARREHVKMGRVARRPALPDSERSSDVPHR